MLYRIAGLFVRIMVLLYLSIYYDGKKSIVTQSTFKYLAVSPTGCMVAEILKTCKQHVLQTPSSVSSLLVSITLYTWNDQWPILKKPTSPLIRMGTLNDMCLGLRSMSEVRFEAGSRFVLSSVWMKSHFKVTDIVTEKLGMPIMDFKRNKNKGAHSDFRCLSFFKNTATCCVSNYSFCNWALQIKRPIHNSLDFILLM